MARKKPDKAPIVEIERKKLPPLDQWAAIAVAKLIINAVARIGAGLEPGERRR